MTTPTAAVELPEPSRLYVIGDIHGCLQLLDAVIERIRRDLAVRPAGDCLTVSVGDYIDRGPDSRGVLDRLASNPFPTDYIALKGNHEIFLEQFLADPSVMEVWRYNGALETLHSYGIDVSAPMRGRGYREAADALRAALPDAHRCFLAALPLCLSVGRYFVCHAGVRPGVPLSRQSADDLVWIREEFLRSVSGFGKIVVHGHTPAPEPEVRPNRINVDTGAFMTGRLTCAALERGRTRFLPAT